MKNEPTQERVRELFIYEHCGTLRRRLAPVGREKAYPWRPGGSKRQYLLGSIDGTSIYLHQAVWIYHRGRLPKMLDHRDNVQSNNRIGNLRPCRPAQNQYNSTIKRSNQAGYKGVRRHVSGGVKCWQAKLVIDGKQRSLGYYAGPAEAGAVYAAALKQHAKQFARAK